MMRTILRRAGYVLAALIGLVLIAYFAVYFLSESRLSRPYTVPDVPVAIPTDAASIKEGERLVKIYGCMECHGANLGGAVFIDDPNLGRIVAANLTSGQNGRGATYKDSDWVRTLRHGVKPDGTAVVIMPSEEYNNLSASDLGEIIAYIKSVPPVDSNLPAKDFRLLGRILLATGRLELFPADMIDHSAPFPVEVEAGPTVEYGAYLALVCEECHGPTMAGGKLPIGPPDAPPAANITPDDNTGLGSWTQDDFFAAMREGIRPDGSEIDDFMPWQSFRNFTDDELTALWLYLETLPPVAKPEATP